MDITFLGRGLVIGFAIAAPVGAIGLLCIRRTLADGPITGFVSGLGAATADTLYGAIAALGLTSVSSLLVAQQGWVRLAGGMLLCFLGVRTAVALPTPRATTQSGRGLIAAYGSTLALTLTNPSTILSFAAIFAGLGLADSAANRSSAVLLIGGVFLGSSLWWLLLCSGVGRLRRSCTPARLRWLNRLTGATLAGLGLFALLSVWK